MFAECTNLTTAPKILPATTLAYGCYEQMFYGCTSLTAAPELPATTLAGNCYAYMFQGCTSLTTAPDLLASNVSDFDMCYTGMFNGCSSLNYIKCLATGSLGGSYCTMYWTTDVAASGTFVKAASMTDWPDGGDGIPTGWTVVNAS